MGCNQSNEAQKPEAQTPVQANQNTNKTPVNAWNWVHHDSFGHKKCGYKGDIILTDHEAPIAGRTRISQKNSYTIQILYEFHPMGFGIVNQKYLKQQHLADKPTPSWYQYKTDKKVWNNGKQQNGVGKGLNEREIFTVKVDSQAGTITWTVGSEVRHRIQDDALKRKDIQWLPYIFIGGTLDDQRPNQFRIVD